MPIADENSIKAEADAILKSIDAAGGDEAVKLAYRLDELARQLRELNIQLLFAANLEGKAKSVRARVYGKENTDSSEENGKQPSGGKEKPVWYQLLDLAPLAILLLCLYAPMKYCLIFIALGFAIAAVQFLLKRSVLISLVTALTLLVTCHYASNCLPDDVMLGANAVQRIQFSRGDNDIVDKFEGLSLSVPLKDFVLRLPSDFSPIKDTEAYNSGKAESEANVPKEVQLFHGPKDDQGNLDFVMVGTLEAESADLKGTWQELFDRLIGPSLHISTLAPEFSHASAFDTNDRDLIIVPWSGTLARVSTMHAEGRIALLKEKKRILVVVFGETEAYMHDDLFSAILHTLRKKTDPLVPLRS